MCLFYSIYWNEQSLEYKRYSQEILCKKTEHNIFLYNPTLGLSWQVYCNTLNKNTVLLKNLSSTERNTKE